MTKHKLVIRVKDLKDRGMGHLIKGMNLKDNDIITDEIALKICIKMGTKTKNGNLSPKYYTSREIQEYKSSKEQLVQV